MVPTLIVLFLFTLFVFSYLLGFPVLFCFFKKRVTFLIQIPFPGRVRALAHPFLSQYFGSRHGIRAFHVQNNISSSLNVVIHSHLQTVYALQMTWSIHTYSLCYQLPSTMEELSSMHPPSTATSVPLGKHKTLTRKKVLWKSEGSFQDGIEEVAPLPCPVSLLGD